MRSTVFLLAAGAIVLLLLVVFTPISLQSSEANSLTLPPVGSPDQVTAQRGPVLQSLSLMPLSFTENAGQWDDRVLFRADAGGATMWFTREGVYYQFTRRIPVGQTFLSGRDGQAGMPAPPNLMGGPPFMVGNDVGQDPRGLDNAIADRAPDSIEHLVIKARFVGANPDVEIVGEEVMEYKCNYFLGNDPAKWRTDVPNYRAVVYKDIYPGIDLRCSGEGNGKAGYEFVAAPGADLGQVRVEYEGVEDLAVDEAGQVVAKTAWGEMTAVVTSPADQASSDMPRLAPLAGSTPGFRVAGENTPQTASFAVTLDYSTYLGGSDDDWGWDIAVDGFDCAYVTGTTWSFYFPTTPGAYDRFMDLPSMYLT